MFFGMEIPLSVSDGATEDTTSAGINPTEPLWSFGREGTRSAVWRVMSAF
jgi:hypothetical protein